MYDNATHVQHHVRHVLDDFHNVLNISIETKTRFLSSAVSEITLFLKSNMASAAILDF